MNKTVKIKLHWKYSPSNYVEESISLASNGWALEISDGKALAVVEPSFFSENPNIDEELRQKIDSRLRVIQLMTHKPFDLSNTNRTDTLENGAQRYYVQPHSMIQGSSIERVDTIVKDKDGRIVADSKRDRLNKQERYASLIEKYCPSDNTLRSMLDSYRASVSDPDNELVHLYEIREVLVARFGSKKNALNALSGISSSWEKIGKLANSLPLKQGRHRGKYTSGLRNAEASELECARHSASCLIEKYLKYLEKGQVNS